MGYPQFVDSLLFYTLFFLFGKEDVLKISRFLLAVNPDQDSVVKYSLEISRKR